MIKEDNSWDLYKFQKSVIHDFDVSVVMPFYKRFEEFELVFSKNAKYLQRNGIEVVISLDNPEEEDCLIKLIKTYPFVNWKLIVNKRKHSPRNPAKVINVGIRHATKSYIMVSDPEVEFFTDVIFELRQALEYYQKHYAVGKVAFVEMKDVVNRRKLNQLRFMEYGSFMVEKKYLKAIQGYDESFKKWGGEDDNIRKRFDLIGLTRLLIPQAKSLHREKVLRLKERLAESSSFGTGYVRKIYLPNIVRPNKRWGKDFKKVAYDYQNNPFAEDLCRNYLKDFVKFQIKNDSVFSNRYQKIILCQSYNESELLQGFFDNVSQYFDGIIMLDDGSTDGTYQLAKHEKILLKVRKKRTGFDDLVNRNILLNLASFIKSEWYCFMDFDERFDARFMTLGKLNLKGIDVVAFQFIHLWDEPALYNSEIYGLPNGIFRRLRMFRNVGRTQINTPKKKLHFTVTPLRKNILESPILVHHLGLLSKSNRLRKYNFYQSEDLEKDQQSYMELLKTGKLRCVTSITKGELLKTAKRNGILYRKSPYLVLPKQ